MALPMDARARSVPRPGSYIEHHSRLLIHCNVTAHPSAQWTRQQLREALGYETRYEYLIHDRDSIFSADLDESVKRLGLRVLKSPPRSPTAILGELHHAYSLAPA